MLIPLRDENPSRSFPVVTIGLIVVNVLVFAYEVSLDRNGLIAFVGTYGAVPGMITGQLPRPTSAGFPSLLTLFTSMFLHGGFLHLLGNMWFLWIFGDNVEDAMGKARYLAFYFIGGLAAALSHVVTDIHSAMPMVGASGAIAAVLGSYMILYPRARVSTLFFLFFIIRIIYIPAFYFLAFWFLFQILASSWGGQVAWFAHIGGFIAGVALTFVFAKKRRKFPILG